MPKRNCLAIILAAGEGKRMQSAVPKVVHKVGGLPMLAHVLETASIAGAGRRAVVVGAGAKIVTAMVKDQGADAAIYRQTKPLGTAHAVLAARREFQAAPDDILILYGDTPLLTPKTLLRLRAALAKGADIVALGFRTANPTGYGRLLIEKRRLIAIREEKDADKAEREIDFCNAGVMGFRGTAAPLLKKIGKANAKGEYYLTDLIAIANRQGLKVTALEGDESEFLGVNSRIELAAAERAFQNRARNAALAAGVTLIAPETVWFSHDTKLGRDVVVEPNVFFAPGVSIGKGATIRANSYLEEARVAAGAIVGPFARLRPGANIGRNVRIGNFVEVKNSKIGDGAKLNHLSYVGDTHVGAAANIGAGTITCNYDGFDKHVTEIGAGAFVGSNSSLVAPVSVGAGAYIASGSVVTLDVPKDAMAVARGRQVNKPGWAANIRDKKRERRSKP